MSNIDIAQIVIDVFKELELHSDTYKEAAFNCIEKYIELNKNSVLADVNLRILSIKDKINIIKQKLPIPIYEIEMNEKANSIILNLINDIEYLLSDED